ncbi:hypothetical protein ACQEU6_08730 [Spirillospora sp. CA-108201]
MTTQVWAGTDRPEIRFFASEDAAAPMACSRCGNVLGADPFSAGPDGAACGRCHPIVLPTRARPGRASSLTAANRLLARAGVMLVPRPPFTGKALHEVANVTENHHPARGGNATRWLRHVAAITNQSRPRGER